VAFVVNTVFSIVEIIGGFYFGSMAILSNALHDVGDSFSLVAAWFFQKKSQGKRSHTYTYGYKRFSLLGAFINSMILIAGSALILSEAIQRLFLPHQTSPKGMIIFSVIGIVVNLFAMLRLRKGDSLNERVVGLHFLEDTLGWVVILLGAVVMMFKNIPVLDPILSIGIALFILFNVYRNMRTMFQIILQGTPLNIKEDDIKNHLSTITGIKDMHDIHVWTLDGKVNILTMHVVLDSRLPAAEVEPLKNKIKDLLHDINIHHATIETEPEDVNCTQEHDDHSTYF